MMQTSSVTDDALLASIIQRRKIQPHIIEDVAYKNNSPPPRNLRPIDDQKYSKHSTDQDYLWNYVEPTGVLLNELQSRYGNQAHSMAVKSYNTSKSRSDSQEPRIIDEILNSRLREHSNKVNANADEMRELIAKKEKIQHEKKILDQQKQTLVVPPSPTFTISDRSLSEPPPWDADERFLSSRGIESPHSVHGVASYIRYTSNKLPAEIARYNRHRDEILGDYDRLHKPYDGHLGPRSYQPWQMGDYYMVRGIVDEVVDRFLDSYFRQLPPALNIETAHAVLAAEAQTWSRRRQAIIEGTTMQLIMEEIVLEGTKLLSEEVVEDYLDVYHSMLDRSNNVFVTVAEEIALNKDGRRQDSDSSHELVTKTLYRLQEKRNMQKSMINSHSQRLSVQGSQV